ncbi:MAG: hypothetical protein A2169_10425 [Deltaproteobacteria bacterium RBG_13_47_9]|nr:MAG: hypothetical protein A2169_10425 [Deltaproteobacteria bacterium RBG_13_47_9]
MRTLESPWQEPERLKAKVRKITLLLEKQYGIPNLIRFGRSVCRAKVPRCWICFLRNVCVSLAGINSKSSAPIIK